MIAHGNRDYVSGDITIDYSGSSGAESQNHTHTFTTDYSGSSIDTESRPDNLTVKIWKRIS